MSPVSEPMFLVSFELPRAQRHGSSGWLSTAFLEENPLQRRYPLAMRKSHDGMGPARGRSKLFFKLVQMLRESVKQAR